MQITTRKIASLLYAVTDYVAALLAWFLFFSYRKSLEIWPFGWEKILSDPNLKKGLLYIPIAWMLIYIIFDKYQDVFRYSRITTFKRTFFVSFFGCVVLLFTVLLDDTVLRYINYFKNFMVLFGLHFGITVLARMIFLTFTKRMVKNGKIQYNTLLVGGDQNAVDLVEEIGIDNQLGNNFVGFIDSNGNSKIKESVGVW